MQSMWREKILSPAKLNLGLWILGKRPDGYHEILTIFQTVDLFDEIYISEGPLRVETNTGIPQEENLVYKALLKYSEITGEKVEFSIFINKRIPAGSGLGGGSSNVAFVLKKINELTGNPLSTEELKKIAGSVSSDAPFFFECGTAIGRGRGEIIEKVENLNLSFTLIIPEVSSSTKRVYSAVTENDYEDVDIYKVLEELRRGNYGVLKNRLGEIACEIYPEIGEVGRFLKDLGYEPLVTGSGSGVFYINRNREEPSPEVERGALLRGWRVYRVRSWPGA